MHTKSIWTKLLTLIFSVSLLASCGGGGGGGTPPPPTSEGSITSPVNLGTASTTITHAGSISAEGTSFYTFTAGSTAGSYTISLTNTHSDLLWAVLSNSDFMNGILMECDNFVTAGANNEICSVTLSAGTTYYLGVAEWDKVAGTFTLTIIPPGSAGTTPPSSVPSNEGSIASPANLGTVSPPILTHAGSISAGGASYYLFTTASTSGSYTISLTNTHSDLEWTVFSNSGFTSLVKDCNNFPTSGANNESCSVTVTAGTIYYLRIKEWDNVAGTYTLTINTPGPSAGIPAPSDEGSIASPVSLGTASTTITHAGSISADSINTGTSFYTFTTGSTAGSYTISLTNTQLDLGWVLLSDPGFTTVIKLCDNYITSGTNEICSVTLAARTTYYLVVESFSSVAGTFTITIAP
jgi:hypothetical protein